MLTVIVFNIYKIIFSFVTYFYTLIFYPWATLPEININITYVISYGE